jgi:membrane-associated phospholipid phosphatase
MLGASRVLVRTWLLPSSAMSRRLWLPLIGLAYIATIAVLGGLTRDHILLGMLGLLDVYNEKTRLFLRTFLPFIATGAIFDSMRYFYWDAIEGRVHVADPYLFDRAWFGVGGRTLNEYFVDHHWAIADLASGFAYLTFVAEYLGLAMLLFLRDQVPRAATFARCFLVVNMMGFVTYFIYPAAPPWYVSEHGFGPALRNVQPSAAAAHRFDLLLGTRWFDEVYGHGVDVFGAIPSLHSAYPIIAAVLAFRMRELRWARWPAAAFAALMWFSAVYLQHHYVIDVVMGVSYGMIAVAVVAAWERRRSAPAR